MFMADLARLFHLARLPLRIDFMTFASYGSGTVSSGTVRLLKDLSVDVQGRRVLLVDDILDSGRTMARAYAHLVERRPAVLKTCVFLDKPARRAVDFRADYVAFEVPNEFVVGYGLDYDGRFREMPWVSRIEFTGVPQDAKIELSSLKPGNGTRRTRGRPGRIAGPVR
jgi:hypoxanthine phosphoribosyltransferase